MCNVLLDHKAFQNSSVDALGTVVIFSDSPIFFIFFIDRAKTIIQVLFRRSSQLADQKAPLWDQYQFDLIKPIFYLHLSNLSVLNLINKKIYI